MNSDIQRQAAAAAREQESQIQDYAGLLAAGLATGRVELPSWSHAIERARAALVNRSSDSQQLVRLVAADAGLALRVLTLANSALLARGGKSLTDLQTALARIGRDNLRGAVYADALAQLRNAPRLQHLRADLAELWREATTVAALARLIAARCGAVDPDEAMLAGLLHNIGKLYLLANLDPQSPLARNQTLRATLLSCSHARIGELLTQAWQLPERLCAAIAQQETLAADPSLPLQPGEVLAAAIIATGAPDSLEVTAGHLAQFSRFGLDADAWLQLLQRTREVTTTLRAIFGD